MIKLRRCVLNKTKDELIKIIASNSDRYNDKLIEFLDRYKLRGLQDATVEQLSEYITTQLNSYNKEKGE